MSSGPETFTNRLGGSRPCGPSWFHRRNLFRSVRLYSYTAPAGNQHSVQRERGMDIDVSGTAVRYKVYARKGRKPLIKYCIGFDEENPEPERNWQQFSDASDPEAAVRAAVLKQLPAASAASEPATAAGGGATAASSQSSASSSSSTRLLLELESDLTWAWQKRSAEQRMVEDGLQSAEVSAKVTASAAQSASRAAALKRGAVERLEAMAKRLKSDGCSSDAMLQEMMADAAAADDPTRLRRYSE